MPKYGADGDVLEISLHTVKVQNFDKTITTIPTYAMISESFRNWRGMKESGARRIKRAINIDITSIKFCNEELLERLEKNPYLKEYLRNKKRSLLIITRSIGRKTILVERRRLTNIGVLEFIKIILKTI